MAEPTLERRPGRFEYAGRPSSPATVTVRHHERPERVRRALLALGAGWGLAIAALFVPVLHFFLVPALVLGTPLLAIGRWRQRVTLVEASGACPACGRPIQLPLGRAPDESLAFRCDHCGRALALSLDD